MGKRKKKKFGRRMRKSTKQSLLWRTPKLFWHVRMPRSRPTGRRKPKRRDFKRNLRQRSSASSRRKQGPRRRNASVKSKLRSEGSFWKTRESGRLYSRQRSKKRENAKLQRRKRACGPKSRLRNCANRRKKENAPG